MTLWDVFVDVSWIGILLVISQVLRAKVGILQKFFIPASLLAGLFGFSLGPHGLDLIPFSSWLPSYATVLVAVIFAAAPINSDEEYQSKEESAERVKMKWGMTVNLMGNGVFQYGVGILFSIYILRFFFPDLHEGFGLMMATCFYGGPGTAAAVGGALENAGWPDATIVGYTLVSIGIIGGILLGILIINWGARKGYTNYVTDPQDLPKEMLTGMIPPDKQESICKETVSGISLDSMAFHIGVILIGAYSGYLISKNISQRFGFSIPVFVTSLIASYIVQYVLKKTNFSQYIDKPTINRISGSATDILVVSAIASVDINIVLKYIGPIIITSILAFLLNWIWFIFVGGYTSPKDWFERNLIIWGQACGVMATGILLERIVDPNQKAYAIEDTGFANLISRPIITVLTVLPPILIEILPEWGMAITGWASIFLTIFILRIGYRMGWYTYLPGKKLEKGRASLNAKTEEEDL